MTNPCCKYIKTSDSGPYPIYEKGQNNKTIINAINTLAFGAGEFTDFPADIEGNFVDFDKADVEVLLDLYDFSEGFGNELDTGDIGQSFGAIAGKKYYMSSGMRCLLCRRKAQFKTTDGNLSLLDFFEDNLEDVAAAKKLKKELNCEEFGLATYRGKHSTLSCSTDGQGNCKGFENKAYYRAINDDCKTIAPSKSKPAITSNSGAFKNLCDIILAETIKSYLLQYAYH